MSINSNKALDRTLHEVKGRRDPAALPPSDPTPPTDPAAPTDASRGATDPATASAGDGGATVTDATSSDTLMKSMTELISRHRC